MNPTIRIATRQSPLAMAQSRQVAELLSARQINSELVPVISQGDADQQQDLSSMGGVGVFTRQVDAAVVNGAADMAVHSFKDLPTAIQAGLTVTAVPKRAAWSDVLVVGHGEPALSALREGAVIGTGSPRRRAQLLQRRSDLQVVAVRGNIDTRIRKMQDQNMAGLILAEAGLQRLGLTDWRYARLDDDYLPAAAQGALALVCRSDDTALQQVLAALDDPLTHACVTAERAVLQALGAGCHAPVGALAEVDTDGEMCLRAGVFSHDGCRSFVRSVRGASDAKAAVALGRHLASVLLAEGAGSLIHGDLKPAAGICYLVGAGPGDPGLLTLRGSECLKQADVVYYDYLVDTTLPAMAPVGAEKVYVGKQAGAHSMAQEDLCRLLCEQVAAGRVVVRLKGGDPFVFGRGGEEAMALAEAGLRFEVVPGVTSAVAAAAYAGIAVTHRNVATNLTLVTGHESPDKSASQTHWQALAATGGTLCIYMGVGKLAENCQALVAAGRSAEEPVAVIQWGSTPKHRVVCGVLGDIASRVAEAGLGAPAMVVIGPVVNLRDRMGWFETRPLLGRRVVVTRAASQSSRTADQLRALGADVLLLPTLSLVPVTACDEDFARLNQMLHLLGGGEYDWLVLTSANGVSELFVHLHRLGKDARWLRCQVAAIGPGTALALADHGVQADLVPTDYVGEALAEALIDAGGRSLDGCRICLLRAGGSRSVLPDRLIESGAVVDELAIYRMQPPDSVDPVILDQIVGGRVDVISFTASSTVRHFVQLLGDRLAEVLAHDCIRWASIGPITSQSMREQGIPVDIEAGMSTIAALIDGIMRLFETDSSSII